MTKEKINYEDYVLNPNKDVLVPMETYLAITNVVQEVEKQHSKRMRTDIFSWYNKKTHQKLSKKALAKIKDDKKNKEYYENIDFDETNKSIRVDRDELGSAAVRLMAEFRGVFRHNVDVGNAMTRPTEDLPENPPLRVVSGEEE